MNALSGRLMVNKFGLLAYVAAPDEPALPTHGTAETGAGAAALDEPAPHTPELCPPGGAGRGTGISLGRSGEAATCPMPCLACAAAAACVCLAKICAG